MKAGNLFGKKIGQEKGGGAGVGRRKWRVVFSATKTSCCVTVVVAQLSPEAKAMLRDKVLSRVLCFRPIAVVSVHCY